MLDHTQEVPLSKNAEEEFPKIYTASCQVVGQGCTKLSMVSIRLKPCRLRICSWATADHRSVLAYRHDQTGVRVGSTLGIAEGYCWKGQFSVCMIQDHRGTAADIINSPVALSLHAFDIALDASESVEAVDNGRDRWVELRVAMELTELASPALLALSW